MCIRDSSKNHAINKTIKNLMFEILKNNSDTIAKKCLVIMIELYKSNVWNDEKTVNIIANGCFSDNAKIVFLACKFLIDTTQNLRTDNDSSDDEEAEKKIVADTAKKSIIKAKNCLLYTSPSPRDRQKSRMPSSA
eukprot:TRINITY_DN4817_c0_g1_i1.p1 TRINITY_DN4817_c0_g1~~TRINITY_DN4817_c0_g1_i1.p1  ORF type:complete len:135 (+),score=48.68 TRINITY_DN4817_c0_g1_i1:66-470(+)